MSSFVNLLDVVYPVGSVYMSFESTSPASTVGGTWSQITDRFLYASSSSGSTGGESQHALTVSEMPSHTHYFRGFWSCQALNAARHCVSYDYQADGQGTGYTMETGGSSAHNNMPPYVTCYMWKRTV